jgi:hypothetical protein
MGGGAHSRLVGTIALPLLCHRGIGPSRVERLMRQNLKPLNGRELNGVIAMT